MTLQKSLKRYGMEWRSKDKDEERTNEKALEAKQEEIFLKMKKEGKILEEQMESVFEKLFYFTGRLKIAEPDIFQKRMGLQKDEIFLLMEMQEGFYLSPTFRYNTKRVGFGPTGKGTNLLTFKKIPEGHSLPKLKELIAERIEKNPTSLDDAFTSGTLFEYQLSRIFIPLETHRKQINELEEKTMVTLYEIEQKKTFTKMLDLIEKKLFQSFEKVSL